MGEASEIIETRFSEPVFRQANRADNEELIRLTARGEMSGEMGLRIERSPDFFRLLDMRGDTKVFIALIDNKIIGSLCVSKRMVYVGGKIYPLQYVGDFKIEKSYRNQGLGLKLCDQMADYVISADSDLAYLDVSRGNTKPLSFFRNRPAVPDFDQIGIFHSYQFIGKKIGLQDPGYRVESTGISDELISFLNRQSSKLQLGAVITEKQLEGNEIYVVRVNGNIHAAMCLADTMQAKQNVVTKVSWRMNILLKLLNATRFFSGLSKMPTLNEPVKMIYLKYLFLDSPDSTLTKLLVQHGRNRVYENGYSFLSLSLHEKHPLNTCLSGLFKLTFNSVGMLLSIKNNRDLVETVQQGIPFEDFSLV